MPREGRVLLAQTNRFSAAVRKLLSIKGEEHEINYGVHLEDERPEHSFIKGERLWCQYQEVTSAAGTLSIVGVLNPQDSGIISVVTNLFAIVTADAAVRIQVAFLGTNPFASVTGMHIRDTRFPTNIGSTTKTIATTAPAAGGSWIVAEFPCLANVLMDMMVPASARVPPIVLRPGDALWANVTAVGVNTLKCFIAGYERSLESGELIPA